MVMILRGIATLPAAQLAYALSHDVDVDLAS